jgi:alanine dehydrogenase
MGAVLTPGSRAPTLIDRSLSEKMRTGSAIVDICVDQGGGIDTSRPTAHHEPAYVVDDVVHYCVTNIPAAAGRTSSRALCHATLPYVWELASLGADAFAEVDAGRVAALNIRQR